jgi:N-acetylmuramic acid 6-phosphate etherase
MVMDRTLRTLTTEQINPHTLHIDTMDSESIVRLMNEEEAVVIQAVKEAIPDIAKAVDLIVQQFKKGGRLIYLGAGTSGRLGMLDASECPPTFGVPPEKVQFVLAGGSEAFLKGIEDAEDDEGAAKRDLTALNPDENDCLVAISASGRTPYCVSALQIAQELNVPTVTISCNKPAEMSRYADVPIEVVCGPEVLVGSTRLKAGTAQKMVLNMLSTASMIRLGKAYRNLMVDMVPINSKLRERAKRMVMEATEVSYATAEKALLEANWNVKAAIVMVLADVPAAKAEQLLEEASGFVRKAVAMAETDGGEGDG